jgi:hypothetical protein
MESLLHKFYAASISIGPDGSMLVASTKDRVMIWGAIFCFIGATSLISWLIYKSSRPGKAALVTFVVSLIIPVLIIPSVRKEYIHVTRSEITIESGEWYKPSRTVLKMSNLRKLHETDNQGFFPGNLIGDPNVSWHLTRLDGGLEEMELNQFFNAHRMVVAYYFIDRGFWVERLEDRMRESY